MAVFNSPTAFSEGIDSLVHPSASRDAQEAARHRSFIATRLVGGAVALAALPVYLALWGPPSLVAALAFAWLTTPIAIALYLSRTGRLENAQILSIASFSGLVAFLAAISGGALSPLLAWIVVVPAEAAMSGSRRVLAAAIASAVTAIIAVCVLAATGTPATALFAAEPAWLWPALGALPATLYLGAVAMSGGFGMADRGEVGDDDAALISACPDVIARHRRNGNLTRLSPSAAAVLGVAEDELLGDGLFRRIHVSDRPAYLKALDDAAGGRISLATFRVRRDEAADPGWIWIEMRCRGAADEAGTQPADVVTVLRDISERKSHERDLTRAFEELEQASLAKSRFLARVSHELRTPLNAIIGFSEILSQEMFGKLGQDRNREYAELIRDSGRHLLDLINDILDMSKIESGNFRIVAEPFDLAGLIENCRQLLVPQADAAGLQLETDLPVSLPELVADRRACKQMLLNLLHNAIKFSNPGGRVVVGAYMDGEAVSIYVADEGVGISRDDIKRLGQPFVQLQSNYDRNYEGAGLGLSVVKGLIALHDGSMEIDSEPGIGTRVTLKMPVAAPARQAGEVEEPSRLTA